MSLALQCENQTTTTVPTRTANRISIIKRYHALYGGLPRTCHAITFNKTGERAPTTRPATTNPLKRGCLTHHGTSDPRSTKSPMSFEKGEVDNEMGRRRRGGREKGERFEVQPPPEYPRRPIRNSIPFHQQQLITPHVVFHFNHHHHHHHNSNSNNNKTPFCVSCLSSHSPVFGEGRGDREGWRGCSARRSPLRGRWRA